MTQMSRRRQFLVFALGLLVTALIAALIVSIITAAVKSTQVRDTQQENAPKIDNTNRLLKIVEGCTTPGKPCYQRGQRQIAGAVSDIGHISVIAAYCASVTPSALPAITRCVSDQLLSEQPPQIHHR